MLGDDGILANFYGSTITAVLKRIGAGERHDAVRKTPVAFSQVLRIASTATLAVASAIILGFFFLMRGGELVALEAGDVRVGPEGVDVTFRRQKTRATVTSISVTRRCAAPLLVRVVSDYLKEHTASGPVFPDLRSAADVRRLLLTYLGMPPLLPGEAAPLPWSMRAGGASALFHSDYPEEKLMKFGRWSSRVALMYCVLSPHAQAMAWKGVQAAWWADVV